MPGDIGNQTVVVKFFDDVDSSVVNRIARDVRKVGIYSGGYLSIVSDISVSLSLLDCEISDGTYQVRVTTGSAVPVTVGVATPYVVLRWTYTGSAANDYMDFRALALGGILTNDIVVGKCNYAGATLTGIDYTLRTNPLTMDLFLKVEPTVPASMYIRVRAGRVNYGIANYDVVDQLSSAFTAPGAGSRVDVVYVDTDGIVKVLPGTPGAPGLAPSYVGKVALAEITIASASPSITVSMIKDVRAFGAGGVNPLFLFPSGGIIMWSGAIASIPTGWYLCDGTNGTPDLRKRFIIGADTDSVAVSLKVGSKNTPPGLSGTDNSYKNDSGDNNKEDGGGACTGPHTDMMPPFYALAFIMKS